MAVSVGKTIPDVIGPDLAVLFCGINPGLYSGATGYHFARPGNRFWRAMHDAGFTDRVLTPQEQRELLAHGCGITNLVRRATAAASDLTVDELVKGHARLARRVARHRPRLVAILGVGAYRTAFARRRAVIGEQPETIRQARLWVLPNPSGLNAHYQPEDLARIYGELRRRALG